MRYSNGKLGEKILRTIHEKRALFLSLCAMVVFVTTYLLILPAITLDEETAEELGGIDLPKAEQVKDEASLKPAAGELAYEGDGYTVEAAFGTKAGLPKNTELAVTEIASSDEDYDDLRDEALKAVQESEDGEQVGSLEFAKFYDISFVADGEPVEPDSAVGVSISYDNALEAADANHVRIVHFGTDEEENLVPEVLDPGKVKLDLKKGMMSGTAFAAESFSVYGIVYTVDFHYDTDEQTYDYSIEGGSSVLLSELLEELEVEVSVEDVADVSFSDPELVETTQEDGDWTLTSLQAFDTEETLTITLNSGEELTIRVTDAQLSENVLTADGKNYKITVTYDDEAEIPEGTRLVAKEIEQGSDEYNQYLGRTWSELNREYYEAEKDKKDDEGTGGSQDAHLVNVSAARFFDLTLTNSGKEIDIGSPASVEVNYEDGPEVSASFETGIVCFESDKTKTIEDGDAGIEGEKVDNFHFETSSLSTVGTYIAEKTQDFEVKPGKSTAFSLTDNILKVPSVAETLRGSEEEESNYTEDHSGLDHPIGDKTLVPNTNADGKNDGTYKLTLSVKGKSQTTTETQTKKSNVVFIMDRSSSMITNTINDDTSWWYYGKWNTNDFTFRGDIGGNDNYQFYGEIPGVTRNAVSVEIDGEQKTLIPLNVSASWSDWYNYNLTYVDNNGWTQNYPTNSPLYVKSKTTRLVGEQTVLNGLFENLLGQNTDSVDDNVEIALISFGDQRFNKKSWSEDTEEGWTKGNDLSGLESAVNSSRFTSGTNWEEALQYGYEMISQKKAADIEAGNMNEEYYVVFLTDGEPTAKEGNSPGQSSTPNLEAYDAAKDEARKLVQKGYKFYNIFTYRNPAKETDLYSRYLTNYAYTEVNYDGNAESDACRDYYSDARTTDDLEKVFKAIFKKIESAIGHANVSITDTLTTDAMTTTVVHGKTNGYTYTVTEPNPEDPENPNTLYTVTATGDLSNPTVTFHVPGSTTEDYTAEASEVGGKTVYSITTAEGKTYKMALADVDDTSGELVWDLSPVGMLMNDCTYSVSFIVWPDQDAYDYVAALNNGLDTLPNSEGEQGEPIKVEWNDNAAHDSGNGYLEGGVEAFPSIVKYPDGTYAVLTNKDQKLHYSVVETTTDGTNTETTVNGPYYKDLPLPDPMPLTASSSQIEKVWNINRDPDILAELLYGHPNNHYSISFDIMQDETTTPYTSVGLGWDEDEGEYIWKDSDKIYVKWDESQYKYVKCSSGDEGALPIGTHWIEDFSIATGLMLSETRMTALGLDKTAYTSTTYNGTKYYLLEEGHDYTIDEPDVGFEFDFDAPVYHPMLVDGVLRDVDLKDIVKDENGKVTSFSMTGMSPIAVAQDGRSALEIANTLRGYIHLNKVVVGRNNEPLASDHTAFAYDVVMNNEEAVFIGDSIPWYGISGLFYHDEDSKNYYQAEMRGTQLWLTTEEGGPYKATCPAGFNSKIATVQTITYIDTDDLDDNGNGKEKTIEIYGNQMTPSEGTEEDGYKHVEARLHINQNQTLNIANVPAGTTYSITEVGDTGYDLVSIESDVNGKTVLNPAVDLTTATISGEIVTNSDNHIIYTNKRVVADIKIKKTNEKGEGLSGAVFQLLIKDNEVYRCITAGDGIGGLGNVTVDETTYESAFQSDGGEKVLTKLPDGEYQLNEVHVPAGYINTSGSIYFEIENGVVNSATAEESDKVTLDTSGDGLVIGLLQIENTPGAALPNSGGPGTTWIYLIGSILLLGCGTILVARRRTRRAS